MLIIDILSSLNINPKTNTKIRSLEQDEIYKYLGINKSDSIKHTATEEKIRKEYFRRVQLILPSEPNPSNIAKAINSIAAPLVT